MKTRCALIREKHGRFLIEDLEIDEPRPHEVLIRVEGSGMCHTDLHARDQYRPTPLPMVFGHEGAGIVEKIGEGVTKVKPGDKVVMVFPFCGRCINCKNGKPAYCVEGGELKHRGTRSDGSTTMRKGVETIYASFFGQSSFGSYAIASERNTVKVETNVPAKSLAALCCGVQTGAGAILNTLRVSPGSSLVVFGTGSVGLSAVMAGKIAGCLKIIAVDIKPNRLALAEELGATHTVDSSKTNCVEEIRRITGVGADYTVETSAIPEVLRAAVDSLRPLGTCGLIGSAPPGTEVKLMMGVIQSGRTVRGVIQGDSVPDIFINQLIGFHAQGRFPFERLITFYPLEEINRAAEDAIKGTTIKPVLLPS